MEYFWILALAVVLLYLGWGVVQLYQDDQRRREEREAELRRAQKAAAQAMRQAKERETSKRRLRAGVASLRKEESLLQHSTGVMRPPLHREQIETMPGVLISHNSDGSDPQTDK